MSTSTTTTYFQGGDYVELLSAQGKAPAATWKLQGKILKSFEKTIKGNAFQLEGSTDTKMQLPKTSTTQSLGLSQRFLVFQLLIPFTRSFAIEIGFSDFQKIRRRFVAASAFRETAMTSLHVQIPFGAAQVTRDQWINLVFDLHALTETFFPGSTFRSMESICISGSCKLKRVFTMKDAPYLKPGVGFPVASFADMKDIPKQFVFTSTTNGPGPIPTEYFEVPVGKSSTSNNIPEVSSSSSNATAAISKAGLHAATPSGQSRTKSASQGRSKPPVAGTTTKTSAIRPTSSVVRPDNSAMRPPSRSDRERVEPPPQPNAALKLTEQTLDSRPSSSLSARSASAQRSLARSESETVDYKQRSDTFIQKEQEKEQRSRHDTLKDEDEDDDDDMQLSPLPMRFSIDSSRNSATSQEQHQHHKKLHRQAIIAEIQHQLDSLTDADERHSDRDSNAFLQYTSIRHELQEDGDNELELLRGNSIPKQEQQQQSSASSPIGSAAFSSLSPLDNRRSSAFRSDYTANAPVKSIFSFAQDTETRYDAASCGRSSYQLRPSTSRLFAFDSLLEPSPVVKRYEENQHTQPSPLRSTVHSDHTPPFSSSRARVAEVLGGEDEDAEEHALAELLYAKRHARQLQQQQSPQISNRKNDATERKARNSAEIDTSARSVDNENGSASAHTIEKEHKSLDAFSFVRQSPAAIVSSKVATLSLSCQYRSCNDRDENSPHDKANDEIVRADGEAEEQDDDEEDDDNLSIDMTGALGDNGSNCEGSDDGHSDEDHERQHTRELFSAASNDGQQYLSSLQESNDGGSERSFDFDDLVEEEARSDDCVSSDGNGDDDKREPSRPEVINRARDTLDDEADRKLTQTPRLSSNNNDTPSRASKSNTSNQEQPTKFPVKFVSSSQHQPTHHQQRSAVGFLSSSLSSSQRLASLLESTDWSQLDPHAHPSSLSSSASTLRPRDADTASSSIELVYDPLLHCYYDPIANKYYALAHNNK